MALLPAARQRLSGQLNGNSSANTFSLILSSRLQTFSLLNLVVSLQSLASYISPFSSSHISSLGSLSPLHSNVSSLTPYNGFYPFTTVVFGQKTRKKIRFCFNRLILYFQILHSLFLIQCHQILVLLQLQSLKKVGTLCKMSKN